MKRILFVAIAAFSFMLTSCTSGGDDAVKLSPEEKAAREPYTKSVTLSGYEDGVKFWNFNTKYNQMHFDAATNTYTMIDNDGFAFVTIKLNGTPSKTDGVSVAFENIETGEKRNFSDMKIIKTGDGMHYLWSSEDLAGISVPELI